MVAAIVDMHFAMTLVQFQVLDRIHRLFEEVQADLCLFSALAGIHIHKLVQPNFVF
jgi:hypothetical protein